MRALLIVNPRATSTTQLRRDVIASALASALQLDVDQTRYRGHATKLAAGACSAERYECRATPWTRRGRSCRRLPSAGSARSASDSPTAGTSPSTQDSA